MKQLRDFLQKRSDRIGAKLSRVKRSGRKTPERIRNLLRVERAKFRGEFPGHHIGKNRTRSNGRNATLRFETHGCNLAVINPHRKPQNIAANRIRHFHRRAGVR